MNNKYDLETLITARLDLQSTQRILSDNYGIKVFTLDYLKSAAFAKRLNSFTSFQKKNLFTVLAGPFKWKSAAALIEINKELV